MSYVGNHADLVHLGDHGATKVAQTGVGWFGTAVADWIAAVVGQVHHAAAELEELADKTQFLLDRGLFSWEGYAVTRLVDAVASSGFCGDDVVGEGGARHVVAHAIRQMRIVRQPPQHAHGVVALLAGILKGARHPGRLPGPQILGL